MSKSSVDTAQYFEQLNEFMKEVAAEKTAAANTEAGGHEGASSHPSTDVDDSTADASEGARSAENSADVKDEVGGKTPDDISEGDAGPDQDDRQLNIGTQQSATGEDPSVENDFKGDKDDPGTSHPADTEDGEKFGSLERDCEDADFMQAKTAALSLGNEILADFANGFGFGEVQYQKKAQALLVEEPQAEINDQPVAPPAEQQAEVTAEKQAEEVAPEAQEAADAGYQLAAVLGMEKLSEEQRASLTIEQTVKDASHDADLVGSYLNTLAAEAEKQAEGDLEDVIGGAAEAEDHDSEGDEESGMEEGGDISAESPEAGLLAEMAGGEGGLPEEELGLPEEDGLPGLPEEALGLPEEELGLPGELPPEGGGGISPEQIAAVVQALVEADAAGPASDEEVLQQAIMGSNELGIPEEELMAAGPEGAKLASAFQSFKRSGKFQFKEATSDRERQIRDLMKAHVLELVG